LIDFSILIIILGWEYHLKIINLLGLAWWAKIDTSDPQVCYFFGPFLTSYSLKSSMKIFTKELSEEIGTSVVYIVFQGCCKEPLTLVTAKNSIF